MRHSVPDQSQMLPRAMLGNPDNTPCQVQFGHTLRNEERTSDIGASANDACRIPPRDAESDAIIGISAASSAGHSRNETLYATLATSYTRPPQRAVAPNSSKKRRPLPNLSRAAASPGHGTKMSTIFRDASASLQALRSPPRRPTPNSRRTRLPFSQSSKIDFGSDSENNAKVSQRIELSSPAEQGNEGPINSGFVTPPMPPSHSLETPEEIRYPSFEAWQLPQSSSVASGFGSGDNNSQSSDGILEVTPISKFNSQDAPSATVDTWLAGIPTSTGDGPPLSPQFHNNGDKEFSSVGAQFSHIPIPNVPNKRRGVIPQPKPLQGLRAPSRASSNKENVSPIKSSPSPTRPQTHYPPRTPSGFRNGKTKLPPTAGAVQFAHPFTTQGHFSVPPKRKKARVNKEATSDMKPVSTSPKDFTIHDDQLVDALAELSPLVERHRKGKAPKRGRCVSYFDEDIIQVGFLEEHNGKENGGGVSSTSGKKVLGESKQSVVLMKEMPFLEGIKDTTFELDA